MNLKTDKTTEIKATLSSYLVLSGIWVALALANIFISIRSCDKSAILVALLTGGIAFLIICWLNGFRVRIADNKVFYRDGFYKETNTPLNDIENIQTKHVIWQFLPKNIKVPRLALIDKSGDATILINPKPFSRDGIQTIVKMLKK